MSDLRAAAQQALEALMWHDETVRTRGDDEAIEALRAALEQPEQEVKGCDHCNHPLYAAIKCRVCGRVTEQEQEPVPKSTWQKLYEAAIEQRNEAAEELRRLHDELADSQKWRDREEARAERAEAQRDELLQALKDATDAIEHWGAYASDYFQQKWDLQSDINAARAAIARAEGQA